MSKSETTTKKKNTAASQKADLKKQLTEKLLHNFSVQPEDATNEHLYNALVLVLRDRMRSNRVDYIRRTHQQNAKQVPVVLKAAAYVSTIQMVRRC